VGGDEGKGDIRTGNAVLFTLTPTLSHRGRGGFSAFQEAVNVGCEKNEIIEKPPSPER
jgi:hypothetical protein